MRSAAAEPPLLRVDPKLLAVAGALTIAWSAVLVRLAHVDAPTSALFRCLYALPVLIALAFREERVLGARSRRQRATAVLAGVFFAVDLVAWHYAIDDVGAGLATVVANLQVVLVPLAAWFLLGEHPSRRLLACLPLMVTGVVLISGVLEDGAYGEDPLRGSLLAALGALTYAVFLLALRHSTGGDGRRVAGPLADATAASALVCAATGFALGDIDLLPPPQSQVWLVLLALSSQVVGWILIGSSLPRLPAAITSVILTLQPAGSMVLGMLIFGEAPTAVQVGGVVMILAGLVLATRTRRRRTAERAGP